MATRRGSKPKVSVVAPTTGPSKRPEGIEDAIAVQDPQRLTSVTLPANTPELFTYIKDADVRNLSRELADRAYDPEQTTKVSILSGDVTIPNVNITPIQYAALSGLKGIVRLLLQKSTPSLSKKVNGLPIEQAIADYRSNDADKNEVLRIFKIVTKSIQDAVDDFSEGTTMDSKYGESLPKDADKRLAKTVYEREYRELQSPKPLVRPKVSGESKQKGRDDGRRGIPKDPAYNQDATPVKSEREQEDYGTEYDKALASYYGEKDGRLNEELSITPHEIEFSRFYVDGPHKAEVTKLYTAAYNANRNTVADVSKEAGYVGTYPPTQSTVTGNYFGFGPELNKIIGISSDRTSSKSDTESSYQEGLVEFVKQVNQLIGQAKYAGYTDGLKKNAKYTTPGTITVNGKQYAVDFGKLNTRLATQPKVNEDGTLSVTPEFTNVQTFLTTIKQWADAFDSDISFDTFKERVNSLVDTLDATADKVLIQRLKPILSSQRGGAPLLLEKERLRKLILTIQDDRTKQGFLNLIDNPNFTEGTIPILKGQVDAVIASQPPVEEAPVEEAPVEEAPVEEPPPVEEAPGIGSKLQSGLSSAASTLSGISTTMATSLGTASTTAASAIAGIPTSIVTGLGSVTTKKQLYDAIKQALSGIRKYEEVNVDSIPRGVSPDDPSLSSKVNVPLRVQLLYDKEFERGTKEAIKAGGTRRQSKKSKRNTKKNQRSKK